MLIPIGLRLPRSATEMLVMQDINSFGDNHTLSSEIIIGHIVFSVISHAAERT